MTKQKTKLSIATCRVLLGVGLALGASSLYAATTIDDKDSIEENFTKNGNNITFTGDDFEIDLGDVSTQNWGSNNGYEAYDPEVNLFDIGNALGGGGGSFKNFNATNESITINAGDEDLTLTTSGADTLNNFTLTSKGDISATNIYFRALLGVSSFNGNTTIDGGGLYVDGGSIVVNGDLIFANTPILGFNADRLNAIQVRGDADLQSLGDIQLSSTSIQSFNNAVLVNVTGELTTDATLPDVTATLQIDDRNYIGTNLNGLSGIVGANATAATGEADEGDSVTFADWLRENEESFANLIDLTDATNTFAEYVLNTNASGTNPATQLRISGGANANVLDNSLIGATIGAILDKYATAGTLGDFDGSGLLYDFADDNDIDVTENSGVTNRSKWTALQNAIYAIESQKANLEYLGDGTTTFGTYRVDDNPAHNVDLVESREDYMDLAPNDRYRYTRNDVFVQNIGNISTNNQNIVARYLDGLELKLQGRTETGSGNDNAYNSTDLHTGDVGAFNDSDDGGRTGRDGNGNVIYDNGAVLDNIARIKLEGGVANTLANQYRESAKSISNTNSAMSSVDSILNITNELSLSSRIAMHDNPYNSYAYQMRGVELAAIASDMSPNYVDTYSSGVWINAFGGANVIDRNSGGVYGVSLGLDAKVSDNVLLGAYFTYADADIKDNLIKQESDNFQIGLYSSVQLAPLWELNLKLFGQISPNDQYRYDVLGSYDSDFTRKSLGFNGNIGRAFKFQQETFVLKPFLGVNYYYTHTPSYSESGAAGFDKVNSATNNTISLDVGAEFRKYTSVNSYLFVTPKIEQYILNNGDDFRATLGGIAMPVVSGADKNKTYGQIIIGGNFDISQDFSANIGAGVKQIFAGKVDSKDETYVSGQVGFKYKF